MFNKMVYSVLTQLQYVTFLEICFGFYKTIFRPMLTIGRYIQCVHTRTLWDPTVKGKAVPLQAWSGPEGSRKLRFPDFLTTAQDGGKVVSPTHRPPLSPGNAPGTHFC